MTTQHVHPACTCEKPLAGFVHHSSRRSLFVISALDFKSLLRTREADFCDRE
jgi:hypothetical protein